MVEILVYDRLPDELTDRPHTHRVRWRSSILELTGMALGGSMGRIIEKARSRFTKPKK